MAAPKKPQAKRVRNARGAVYVPKGSYKHLADKNYLEAKAQAIETVPTLLAVKLGEKGISARMVAQTMGVSLSAIRDRMQKKTSWKAEELIGLAAVYDLNLMDIIGEAAGVPVRVTAAQARGLEALGLLFSAANGDGQLRLDVPA